jgi:hypothetical protein
MLLIQRNLQEKLDLLAQKPKNPLSTLLQHCHYRFDSFSYFLAISQPIRCNKDNWKPADKIDGWKLERSLFLVDKQSLLPSYHACRHLDAIASACILERTHEQDVLSYSLSFRTYALTYHALTLLSDPVGCYHLLWHWLNKHDIIYCYYIPYVCCSMRFDQLDWLHNGLRLWCDL